MIVRCPKCQAKLNVPENAAGKKIRCPTCQETFVAEGEAHTDILTDVTEIVPTVPVRSRAETEDDEPRVRRPRYLEDDQESDELDIDNRELWESTKTKALQVLRFAGRFAMIALIVTTFNFVVNLILSAFSANMQVAGLGQGPNQGAMWVGIIIGLGCSFVLFGIPLVFMFIGMRQLFRGGSRGLIITGLIMNFIMALILGGGALINIYVLIFQPAQFQDKLLIILPTAILNPISTIANLLAAFFTIRALVHADVSEYYRLLTDPRARL